MNDGGPAFPHLPWVHGSGNTLPGMSLRDYFAAKAIALFPFDENDVKKLIDGKERPLHGLVARFCYDLADAMLVARSQEKSSARVSDKPSVPK